MHHRHIDRARGRRLTAHADDRIFSDFIAAARSGSLKFGGTGSKQEDQVLIAAIERAAGVKFIYIPFRGGGEVAVQLVGKHIDASVSNPIEAVAQWRGGQLRPLCIFDSSPVTYTERIADRAWSELPTCKSQGLDVEYTMLRGLFMSPGVSAEQVEFYVDLMRKVTATPEWRKLMQDGAFNPAFLTGPQFRTWLAHAEWQHYELMQSAGFATVAQPPSRPSGAPPQLGMPASPPAAAPAVVEPRPAPPPPPPAVAATPPPQIAVPQIATPQTAPAAPRADFGRRVALVIGNSAYKAVAPLANPRRDAETVAAALRGVGFQNVTVATDLTREKLLAALLAFAREAERADWGLIYYAGHGIELGGVNYLIPVDARLASDRDVELEAVSFNQALGAVERAGKLRLVLLDACRDNPFASQMRRTLATRSIGRGLASVEPEPGTLVVYAAKHGETALDGEGTNSPFVTALVQRLAVPGLEVRRLFDYVRDDVLALTRRRQQPFSYGSLPASLDFYFVQK